MRQGSLENPEVHEDVPGHIIPILQREFDDFDNEAEKFLGGGTPENEFIGFRLKQGVYGQRQADVQMIRVKLPFGGITPDQMDTLRATATPDLVITVRLENYPVDTSQSYELREAEPERVPS